MSPLPHRSQRLWLDSFDEPCRYVQAIHNMPDTRDPPSSGILIRRTTTTHPVPVIDHQSISPYLAKPSTSLRSHRGLPYPPSLTVKGILMDHDHDLVIRKNAVQYRSGDLFCVNPFSCVSDPAAAQRCASGFIFNRCKSVHIGAKAPVIRVIFAWRASQEYTLGRSTSCHEYCSIKGWMMSLARRPLRPLNWARFANPVRSSGVL